MWRRTANSCARRNLLHRRGGVDPIEGVLERNGLCFNRHELEHSWFASWPLGPTVWFLRRSCRGGVEGWNPRPRGGRRQRTSELVPSGSLSQSSDAEGWRQDASPTPRRLDTVKLSRSNAALFRSLCGGAKRQRALKSRQSPNMPCRVASATVDGAHRP